MSEVQLDWVRRGDTGGAQLLLEVEDLSVKVGIRDVIRGLSFTVGEGDRVHVKGPNGSGKSSLLNAIMGLDPACVVRGRVMFRGVDVTSIPAHERARGGLRYLRQRENVFVDLSVDENLRVAAGASGPVRFSQTFPDWASQIPGTRRASLLSGGQRQRLAWAMTMLRGNLDRDLLLADEPEAGLSESLDMNFVRTLIVATHATSQEAA